MAARRTDPVLRLPGNALGRDFVVGDIHGCFDTVWRAMEAVSFDPARDRIVSLGDLIDRGPQSHAAPAFLRLPFVTAVRGNHEDMLLELYGEGEPRPEVLEYAARHNGFGWWLGATDEQRQDVLDAVAGLPVAVEIEGGDGVGFVHADVPLGMSWGEFAAALRDGDPEVSETAMWGRDRIRSGHDGGVDGIGTVFVGHTPLRRPLRLGNVWAVDTAAVYRRLGAGYGTLTFADVAMAAPAARPAPAP